MEVKTGNKERPNVTECPTTVAIIGTGEFARAMATRLTACRIKVVLGSRFPDRRREDVPDDDVLSKVTVTSIPACVTSSDLVIVALHPEKHDSLKPLEHLLAGKVIVDCSNSEKTASKSNAERLADLFPKSFVVKAFNTVSAFALMTMYEHRAVHVCGNNYWARGVVTQLASRLSFAPVDAGDLSASLLFEENNRKLFPGWGLPTFVACLVFVIWTVYAICRYYVMLDTYDWGRFPMNVLQKITGVVSVTLLALSQLPGSIAAFTQLANGTKHKRFRKGLDNWLKMRKQLGLYALFFGGFHMVQSMSLLSPAYFDSWYREPTALVPANQTEDLVINVDSKMNWIGETCVLLGFIAIFLMGILGITSINSVANSLNWREWRWVQSYLGFFVLVFALGHMLVKGGTGWTGSTWKDILPDILFLSSLLPWFTMALRLILFLPCVFSRVNKIRRGWESGVQENVVIVVDEEMTRAALAKTSLNGEKDNAAFDDTVF